MWKTKRQGCVIKKKKSRTNIFLGNNKINQLGYKIDTENSNMVV